MKSLKYFLVALLISAPFFLNACNIEVEEAISQNTPQATKAAPTSFKLFPDLPSELKELVFRYVLASKGAPLSTALILVPKDRRSLVQSDLVGTYNTGKAAPPVSSTFPFKLFQNLTIHGPFNIEKLNHPWRCLDLSCVSNIPLESLQQLTAVLEINFYGASYSPQTDIRVVELQNLNNCNLTPQQRSLAAFRLANIQYHGQGGSRDFAASRAAFQSLKDDPNLDQKQRSIAAFRLDFMRYRGQGGQ